MKRLDFSASHALLPAPGTSGGPCNEGRCAHRDCFASRLMASTPCAGCGDLTGYERPFFTRGVQVHVECLAAAVVSLFGSVAFARGEHRSAA